MFGMSSSDYETHHQEIREKRFADDFLMSGKLSRVRLGPLYAVPNFGLETNPAIEPEADLSGIVGRQCFCCNQPATTTTQDGKYNVCAEHTWFVFRSYSNYRGEHE